MKKMTMLALAALFTAGIAAGDALAWGGPGGPGGRHGGMGGPGGCSERETPLTTDQVRDIIEGQMAWKGENLKVGNVAAQGDAIVAQVIDSAGKVVRTVKVDPKTGRFSR